MSTSRLLPWHASTLLLLTGAAASSQSTFVLPPEYSTKAGNTHLSVQAPHLTLLPSHTQVAYDMSYVPAGKPTVNAIAFRRPADPQFSYTNPTYTLDGDVAMAVSTLPPSAFGDRFSANGLRNQILVFSGRVTFPSVPFTSTLPPFVARIPFTRPFVFDPSWGKSLVVEFWTWTSSTSSDPGGAGWRVDAYRADSPPTLANGSQLPSCADRNGKQIYTWDQKHTRVIGSRYRPRYYPCLPNAVGVASIGTKMGGERWGNVILPLQLWPTQCRWHTDSFLFWPLIVDAAGWGEMAALAIPYDLNLVGFRICDQPAIFDPLANVLGIVPGPSVCFTFASALHTVVATRLMDTTPPNDFAGGTVGYGYAPIIEFTR